MPIHPTAIVAPGAQINETAEIGPYCVIDANVEIGAGSPVVALAVEGEDAGVFAELKVTARPFVSSTIPQHTHGLVGPIFCLSFARLSLGNALPYDAYPYSATK